LLTITWCAASRWWWTICIPWKKPAAYWYANGYNRVAVWTVIPAACIPMLCVLVPTLQVAANYARFIGMGLGFVIYLVLSSRKPSI